jgi:hypothetical protein
VGFALFSDPEMVICTESSFRDHLLALIFVPLA